MKYHRICFRVSEMSPNQAEWPEKLILVGVEKKVPVQRTIHRKMVMCAIEKCGPR